LTLGAVIAEVEALRYTPAGIPALTLKLDNESECQEAEQMRQVKMTIKAMAFGALAERLVKQPVGSQWEFRGFLANSRGGKQIVFHIQEFTPL
jgi:primosomal replication protein N